jgi:hypothetical protein
VCTCISVLSSCKYAAVHVALSHVWRLMGWDGLFMVSHEQVD